MTWTDEQEEYEEYIIENSNSMKDEDTDLANLLELAFYLASDDEAVIGFKAWFYNSPCW